jgi:WD40 repeat protein
MERVVDNSAETKSKPMAGGSVAAEPDIAASSSNSVEHSLDWQNLRPAGALGGLLPEPQKASNGIRWQIRPWLPPVTQHAHYLTENRVAIAPTGQSYAVITPYDCKIMDLASGEVTHTIPSPANSRWGGVAVTANAEHVALLSEYGDFVEVHDARNRIIAQWDTGELIETANSFGAIAWVRPGEQLMIWDSRHASIVDLSGKLQTSIDFPAGAGAEQDPANARMLVQRCVDAHPEGKRLAFGCADGRTRIWNLTENQLSTLPSQRGDEPVRSVHWSPDGKLLAALRAEQWTHGVALETWDLDSKLLSTVEAAQLNATHQSASEFAWSPDSRSLALGSGKVIDFDGKLLRELNLLGEASQHGSPRMTSAWIPSWTTTATGTQRIDYVATGDTYGLQCGSVKAFTPSGRVLPSSTARNVLQPQEASWIEETGELAVVFSQPDSSLLRTLSIDGKPQRSVAIPNFITGKIQARTGKLLCYSGGEMSIFDRSGSLLGSYPHGPDHEFELSHWQWDHAGKRIANFGRDVAGGVIQLVDDSGKRVEELRLPGDVSKDGFNASSAFLAWSPNDQHLVLGLLMEDATQRVFVWDLNEESTPSHSLVLTDDQTPRLAWSPDGQWLAVAPGSVDPARGTTLQFLHVDSGEVKENPIQHNYYPQWHAPEWFDERSIRVGGLALNLPAEPSGEIRVRDLGFTLQHAIAAVNMKRIGEVLLVTTSEQGGNQLEVWKDGSLQSAAPAPQITNSTYARNPTGTKAAFLTGNPSDAFLQIDLNSGAVDYIGMALGSDTTLELAADGSLRNPTSKNESYLGYSLRYPGGTEVTMTQAEFENRKQSAASESALQWIMDIGGAVQVEDSPTWFSIRHDADALAALSASQVVSVDLTGCMLTNETLAQLIHFENLQSLDLSHTRLTSLEFLPKLQQLNALSLRHLQLTTLSTLQHVDSLRSLDLSHSPFDSSIATTLLSAKNLQSLNLSHTQVDRFLLSDLAGLPNLIEVDIRQTQISPADAAKFADDHRATRVRIQP